MVAEALATRTINNSTMPRCLSNSQRKMGHETIIISTMPVRCPWLSPYQIARLNPARLPPTVTDPARSNGDIQHLSSLVGMPVCS